jgi:hypothetical protein
VFLSRLNRNPPQNLIELDSRLPDLLLLIGIRSTGPMNDRAEDADTLSSPCGHETPDVNAALAAAHNWIRVFPCLVRGRYPC